MQRETLRDKEWMYRKTEIERPTVIKTEIVQAGRVGERRLGAPEAPPALPHCP